MLVIAGGGTGGHVLAGIAVAQEWARREGPGQVHFVGASGGIEERLVPRAGFPLFLVALGSLKGVSWPRRFKTLLQLPLALLNSAVFLWSKKPSAVLGVGGYASGPLVLMSRLLGWTWGGCRVAILEQNAVPGFTNRILGRVSHFVLSAFPGIEGRFPGKKVITTGNPVRDGMVPLSAAPGAVFTVFVFGGSQGARGINSLVLETLPRITDLRGKLRWIHQTGEADLDRVKAGHAEAGFTDSRVEKFVYDMIGAYQEARLVVSRAGSSTLAEIAAVGRPAVLIPFPYASDNHQEKNARIFEAKGAARVLPQFETRPEDFEKIIREAVNQPDSLRQMGAQVLEFYRPHAARDIVDSLVRGVESVAR